jgi:hypothetical protein
MGTADGDRTPAWELEVTAPDKKNEKPFSYICELHATGNSLQTESTKLDGFFNRRRTQTRADIFVPRPFFALASYAMACPRDKKHVNRYAIIFINVPV